ncbi:MULTISPECIES: hypothetical protein [unclassified Aureispira]|uniref:hypothetical protein n=1 Tax=unclassified Aureispira TaxID=2649989 RepID=UPI000698EF77|nr:MULTISPECIES: hypothetical protein [unclassified Aureispira]WMX14924.1 hypothetical protein QP953_00910 [Aureispira sp. CCB-E]
MKINSITILIACFLLLNTNLKGQKLIDDTRTLKVLVFEHTMKDKKKLVSQGGRVKYKLRGDAQKVQKGTLEDIKEGAMVIDGKEIQFNDCAMIGGRVSSQEVLVGGITLGASFTGLIVGATLLGNVTLGGTVIAAAVVGAVVGIILITKYKRFNLDKGWEVHSGQIIYSTTD